MIIDDLLKEVIAFKASDLHISAGLPPVIRVDGKVKAFTVTLRPGESALFAVE